MGMDLMAMGMGMAMAVPENLSRYQHVYMAKLAEQTKRYKEMVKFMEMVVVCSRGELTGEERNLLSVASKKVVGSLRDAWQTVSLNEDNVVLVKNYISTVESELSAVCTRILKLLDTYLIPSASDSESKVFYLKMKGDYHRYLAEFKIGTQKEEAAFDAILAYKAAQHIALADLAPTHPTRLGLALNLSVFFYQILDEPEKACSKAREAIDEAMDTLGDKSYKDDTAAVMQLLKDNLNLWG